MFDSPRARSERMAEEIRLDIPFTIPLRKGETAAEGMHRGMVASLPKGFLPAAADEALLDCLVRLHECGGSFEWESITRGDFLICIRSGTTTESTAVSIHRRGMKVGIAFCACVSDGEIVMAGKVEAFQKAA